LAKYFEQVEILERDRPPVPAASRSGSPQDRHPHGLLAGGLHALGKIFPGFENDLAGAGAVLIKVARDVQYERADVGALPHRDFGISLLCASRPLIELVLRRRAEAIANVALRPERRVTGIVPATADGAVRGVLFAAERGHSGILEADLVVDASGRAAPTLALLDALGWERPAQTEIGVDTRAGMEPSAPTLNGARHRPRVADARSLSLALAAGRSRRGHFGADRVAEVQRGARHRECSPHRRLTLRTVADHATIFERQAVRIFEVDRLGPLVVDDVGDLNALGAEFVALLHQGSRRAGLEGKVIKAGGNTQSSVDASIIVRRYAWDALGFQESDELIAPDVEKEVPKPAAFFDRWHDPSGFVAFDLSHAAPRALKKRHTTKGGPE
jgi:hypothetical protein